MLKYCNPNNKNVLSMISFRKTLKELKKSIFIHFSAKYVTEDIVCYFLYLLVNCCIVFTNNSFAGHLQNNKKPFWHINLFPNTCVLTLITAYILFLHISRSWSGTRNCFLRTIKWNNLTISSKWNISKCYQIWKIIAKYRSWIDYETILK